MFKVDADPGEVGLDADRLRRLDDVFRSYVDDGRLPGWTLAVTRRGKVAHLTHHGLADLDSGRPVGDDTLWRIYSMTKPITSVAAMMLYEQGASSSPTRCPSSSRSSPTPRVYVGGSAAAPGTRPAVEPMRVWHLLTHTAGLTYGFHHAHAVDEMYRGARLRVRGARGPGPRGGVRGAGRGSRCCSTRARSGTTPWPPTCSAASSRSCPGCRSTGSSPSASSARSA